MKLKAKLLLIIPFLMPKPPSDIKEIMGWCTDLEANLNKTEGRRWQLARKVTEETLRPEKMRKGLPNWMFDHFLSEHFMEMLIRENLGLARGSSKQYY